MKSFKRQIKTHFDLPILKMPSVQEKMTNIFAKEFAEQTHALTLAQIEYIQLQERLLMQAMQTESSYHYNADDTYLLEKRANPWIFDHCPSYTKPALALMTILDMMASFAAKNFTHRTIVQINNVRVYKWVIVARDLHIKLVTKHRDEKQMDILFQINEKGAFVTLAAAQFIFAERYPVASPSLPAPLSNLLVEPEPYSYLFHGSAYQKVEYLAFGQRGSSMLLRVENKNIPIGYLNHALLDASTHGIYHKHGLSFWSDKLPNDSICFPVMIKSMNFYSALPKMGLVRCEARFSGFYLTHQFPIFHVYLIYENQIWCEYQIIYTLFSLGFLNEKKQFLKQFLGQKEFIPHLTIANILPDEGVLTYKTLKDILKQQWFPNMILDIYGISEKISEVAVGKEILIKDYFGQKLQLHPSKISIISQNFIAAGQKLYHFSISEHDGDCIRIHEVDNE